MKVHGGFVWSALLSWTLALACAAPLATAQSAVAPVSDATSVPFAAPPRRVDDILRLLDDYQPDPALLKRARDTMAMMPPAGADDGQLVDFFRRRAIAAARLGQVDRQIADLQAAIAHSAPNSLARAMLLGALATAQATGDSQLAAARSSDEALLQLPRGNPGRQLALLQASVKYYASLGDLPTARERLRRAEQTFAQLSDSRGWTQRGAQWTAMIHRARAEIFLVEGRLIEAEGSLRKAIVSFDAHLQQSLSQKLPQNSPDGEGDTVLRYDGVLERTLAVVLLQQGRLAEAEFHVRRALRMTLERVGRDSVDVGQGLAVLSNILGEQGRNGEATRVAEASMRASLEAGALEFSLNLARARQFLGAALSAQGRHAEAVEVFERNRDILKRHPELLRNYGVGHPEWVISLLQTGKPQAAEGMASAMLAWSVSRFGDDNPRAALRRALVGVARVDQGDAVGARRLFEASVPILVAQARDDAESETGSLRKQRYLIFVLEAWLRALATMGDAAAAEEAFRIADIARGSVVQRALTAAAARADMADAELSAMARREQDAQRRLNGLSALLTQLLAAPPTEQLPQVQEALRHDIAVAKNERDVLRKAIAERFPDYADLVRPQSATLAGTRTVLRSGEALLAFYVGERESYVWAFASTGTPYFSRVLLGREEVSGTVRELRRSLDAGVDSVDTLPPFDLAAAHMLYSRFVAPTADVWREATTLLVVPHGDLAQLPLALLPTAAATHGSGDPPFAGYRQVPWLLRSHAVQQLPSATALVSLRRLPPRPAVSGSFVGFGDPLFSAEQAAGVRARPPVPAAVVKRGATPFKLRGQASSAAESVTLTQLPPLPDTGIELRAIAASLRADSQRDVFLRREATEWRVREMDRTRELERRRVVMFATHGLVPGDIDGLTQPALALTSPEAVPEAGDGLLTMDEVLALRLDADWVVLSACNTAAGEGAGAEALSGLGRAFFYAGARALLVSNWPVETTSARLLMTGMFVQLAGDPSLSKPQALRRAMLALIDSPGAIGAGGRVDFSYAHPLFWAPFVVVGD